MSQEPVNPGKQLFRSLAICSSLAIALGGVFWITSQSDLSFVPSSDQGPKYSNQATGHASSPSNKAQPNEKATANGEKYTDFQAELPPLAAVIAENSGLSSDEITQRLQDLNDEIESEDLINKANKGQLDEVGYKNLARLLQLSDAYYNIKIERQFAEVEKLIAANKKGRK